MEINALGISKDALFQLQESRLDTLKEHALLNAGTDDAEIRAVAGQFEAIFVQTLMSAMRQTVPKSGLFNSFSTDMYESMLDQEIASEVSKNRGIGLAEVIYRELSRIDALIKETGSKPAKEMDSKILSGE